MTGPHDWLDKYTAEHAAHYDMAVEDYKRAMDDLCEAQEQHESEEG